MARSKLSVLVENLCQEPSASLTRACHFALPGLVSSRMCSLTLMVLLISFVNEVYDQKSQRKTKLCSSNAWVSKIFAGKQQKSTVRAEIAGKHCKRNRCVQYSDSAYTYTENCVSTVYEKIVRKKASKCLILLDSGAGIEPVYTDLQIVYSNLNNWCLLIKIIHRVCVHKSA